MVSALGQKTMRLSVSQAGSVVSFCDRKLLPTLKLGQKTYYQKYPTAIAAGAIPTHSPWSALSTLIVLVKESEGWKDLHSSLTGIGNTHKDLENA
jgi:hypothetical protein